MKKKKKVYLPCLFDKLHKTFLQVSLFTTKIHLVPTFQNRILQLDMYIINTTEVEKSPISTTWY